MLYEQAFIHSSGRSQAAETPKYRVYKLVKPSMALLICSLTCQFVPLQHSAAADSKPLKFTTFQILDGNIEAECVDQSKANPDSKNRLSKNFRLTMRGVRVEPTIQSGRHLWGAYGILAFRWLYQQYPHYFQCGYPIDIKRINEGIAQFNQKVLEAASQPDLTDNSVTSNQYPVPGNQLQRLVYALYDMDASVQKDGILVFRIVFKRVQNIRVASLCPNPESEHIISHIQDTLQVRGQKPDALVLREVGLKPGERLPESDVMEKALDRIMNLELFNGGLIAIAPADNVPNHLTYIFCLRQRNEAELTFLEATKIDTTLNGVTARKAISKYKEVLTILRQEKSISDQPEKSAPRNAKKRLLLSLPFAQINRIEVSEAGTLANIASIHNTLGEFYDALHYYSQALTMLQSSRQDLTVKEREDKQAVILFQIAEIYTVLGDRQQAQKYYDEALKIRLKDLRKQQ